MKAVHFTSADLEKLAACPEAGWVDFHAEIGSTNSRAMELAAETQTKLPVLVLAERQSQGRGRGANRWFSTPGALTFSLLLDTDSLAVAKERLPVVSLAAGVAVCRTLENYVNAAGQPLAPQLKWPNDVYLMGRKVCGILVEVPLPGRLVIGVGLNVNNSFSAAPKEVQNRAVSVAEVAGSELSLPQILTQLLAALHCSLAGLGNRQMLQSAWEPYCLLTGRRVVLDQHGKQVAGLCRGIDEYGALRIENDTGEQQIFSAVVEEFE